MAGIGNPDTWSLGQQDTVIAALERAVAKHSDRVLLDFSGELHTYGEVDRRRPVWPMRSRRWACNPARRS